MHPQAPTRSASELAAVLQDLSWLLPRTIGQEAEANLDRLPLSELEVMRLLVRRPALRVGDVARELGLQESNASSSIRSLLARGLVERRRDEQDGRAARLHPTSLAIETRRRRERAWGVALAERLEALAPADRDAVLATVPALHELARALAAGGPAVDR